MSGVLDVVVLNRLARDPVARCLRCGWFHASAVIILAAGAVAVATATAIDCFVELAPSPDPDLAAALDELGGELRFDDAPPPPVATSPAPPRRPRLHAARSRTSWAASLRSWR
jgi:hypothetical protein